VKCPDPRAAREFLQKCDGVVSVEAAGEMLHLFLSPSRTSVAVLEKALYEKGVGPAAFTPIAPSLEDVFIALIRKASENGTRMNTDFHGS